MLSNKYELSLHDGRLGGVVVSVLATGPKVHQFKASCGNGFLRAIRIHSAPPFGWEVKPEALCRGRYVKDMWTHLRC
jgi:hypothetical protein